MEFLKKHVDTVVVVGAIVGAAMWMQSSIHRLEDDVNARFAKLDQDIAIIKTVLIMKNIMPTELASGHDVAASAK